VVKIPTKDLSFNIGGVCKIALPVGEHLGVMTDGQHLESFISSNGT
jgi:hypothetical protein